MHSQLRPLSKSSLAIWTSMGLLTQMGSQMLQKVPFQILATYCTMEGPQVSMQASKVLL